MSGSEIRLRENNAVMLVHPEYEGFVDENWFHPEFWGDQACPVQSGGRGGAWFIDHDRVPLVLRKYYRGGAVSFLAKKSYCFMGETRVRSFSEFRLLKLLSDKGMPVPRPIAAWYRRSRILTYSAVIIVERLENAETLADVFDKLHADAWRRLGQVVRQFHDAGVRHADLNCFNVLVREGEFFLIDFDKGRIESGVTSRQSWKVANLKRLYDSLLKLNRQDSEQSLYLLWNAFLNGYGRQC